MKAILKFLIVLLVIVGVMVAARNILVKMAVETGVQAALGLPLKMGKIELGLKTTHLGIQDLKLYNPKGFPDEVMFHAPEIFVDYDLTAMLKKKVHLEDVRLNFDEFVIVKNKEGKTNIEALKPKAQQKTAPQDQEKPESEGPKKEGGALEIQIDRLSIKVGKLVYKDYSVEGEPKVQEFKVNLSEEYQNISSSNLAWLVLMISNKAIMKTSLSSMFDFSSELWGGESGVPAKALDTLKGTFKGTADTLKDALKLPFGGGQK